MRDPKRISEILKEVESVWDKHPDMRLGQLLLNVMHDPALYYVEDEELVRKMGRFYDKLA